MGSGEVMIKKNISRDLVLELTDHDEDTPISFSVEEVWDSTLFITPGLKY
jgi:hypothetical protein